MKKIISLFQRNYDGDRLVRDEVVPGAEWVLSGEGVATRKWDGTCVLDIREWLSTNDVEGIVWWRDFDDPDCDKVKIKAKDFGIKRGRP